MSTFLIGAAAIVVLKSPTPSGGCFSSSYSILSETSNTSPPRRISTSSNNYKRTRSETCNLWIGPVLLFKMNLPMLQTISSDGLELSSQASAGPAKAEEKKVEKIAFDVKLEKFDTAAKIKVTKEVRSFTSLVLKEAKELAEKAPVLLKQGLSKASALDIIEKIKAVGGVAVME